MSNGEARPPVVQLQLDRLNKLYDDIKELDKKEEYVGVSLSPISNLLACPICNGYLVNATAITECLHVFCRSCLIQKLQVRTHFKRFKQVFSKLKNALFLIAAKK